MAALVTGNARSDMKFVLEHGIGNSIFTVPTGDTNDRDRDDASVLQESYDYAMVMAASRSQGIDFWGRSTGAESGMQPCHAIMLTKFCHTVVAYSCVISCNTVLNHV